MKLSADASRTEITLAIQRYIRARASLEAASSEFNASCIAVREATRNAGVRRMVAFFQDRHYLFTVEDCGGFELEEIEIV